jgi:hypothetical protein
MLGEIVQGRGLRRTALELNMSAGWLSRRLSIRRDPVVFPALEEGRITFAQAHELLSALAIARRTLLDRVLRLRGRVPSAEVRNWVKAVRQDNRHSQQRIVAKLANADNMDAVVAATTGATVNKTSLLLPSFVQLLDIARSLGVPKNADEVAAVGELGAHFNVLWREVGGSRSGVAVVRRRVGATRPGRA